VAVAIDFCSLWQRGSGEEDCRSDFQKQQFNSGLSGFNKMYVHSNVTAIKFIAVPKDERRRYDDRGWTLGESMLIDAKPVLEDAQLSFDDAFDPSADNED